jgi:surface antigen-like variable number repeat protein
MSRFCGFLLIVLSLSCVSASAASLDDLDPTGDWRVRGLKITGNEQISTNDLKAQLLTKTRPWYARWRPLPEFDPNTFARDLERLRRYYQARGYYEANVTYDLEIETDANAVTPRIVIVEPEPVRVTQLTAWLTDQPAQGFGKEGCEISEHREVVQELRQAPHCGHVDFCPRF